MLSKDLEIKFNEQGLVPAIIQDAESNEVLMMAYMNRESIEKTLESGMTHFGAGVVMSCGKRRDIG